MKITKFILFSTALTAITIVGSLNPYPTYAGCIQTTCYCNIQLACGSSNEACIKACGDGGGGGGGGGGGFSATEQSIINQGAKILRHLLFGPQQSAADLQRQQEELQRQKRERQRILEEARRKSEALRRKLLEDQARRRKEFEESKRKMLGTMRGTLTGTLKLRDMSGLSVLEVEKSDPDIFGIRTLKPRELSTSLKPRELSTSLKPSELSTSQINESRDPDYSYVSRCISYLLKKSNEAEFRGDLKERNLLRQEAEKRKNKTGRHRVKCPDYIPEIYDEPVVERNEQVEMFEKQDLVISTLLNKASKQRKDLLEAQNFVTKKERDVVEAKNRLKEINIEVDKLKAQLQTPPNNETPVPDQSIEDKKRAMHEALEALRGAEGALDTNERELATLVSKKENIEKQKQDMRALFTDVNENPESLDELYKEYSSQAEKGGEPVF